jgi:hypothetical protein
MLIQMDLIDDLRRLTIDRLASHGFSTSDCGNLHSLYAALDSHIVRLVLPSKYDIKISEQLKNNPQFELLRNVVDEISDDLRSGRSVVPYLSSQVLMSDRRRDNLLTFWGVHHLHLNSRTVLDKRGLVARADQLLFVRFDSSVAHFIDIISHNETDLFINSRLLEIVDQNWPHLHHSFKKVTGHDLTADLIRKVQKGNANILININGRVIMPNSGVGADGVPMDVKWQLDRLMMQLRIVEHDVRVDYPRYFGANLRLDQTFAHVRLVSLDGRQFELREEVSGSQVRAKWPGGLDFR